MGAALEVIHATRTAPTATIGAAAAVAGDSLVVRNFAKEKQAFLLNVWSDHQAAGTLQVRSPRLHDNQRGLRFDTIASDCTPYLPHGTMQKVYAQDTFVVEFSGSATAGDIEQVALLLYYQDLDGVNGRFIDEATLAKRIVNIVTVENTITAGAGGGYTGSEAINAESDLLVANTDYAILGYLVDTEAASVTWRGPDFGNLRVGGPGIETDRELTRDWFRALTRLTSVPMIPVFNSANRGGTFVEVVQDENAGAPTLITILAQLS